MHVLRNGSITNRSSEINVSMYNVHYERWLTYFPSSEKRQQILIVNSDNLRHNPVEELHKIENFLDIQQFFEKEMFAYNSSSGQYYFKPIGQLDHSTTGCKGQPKDTLDKVVNYLQPRVNDFCTMLNTVNFTWCKDKFSC